MKFLIIMILTKKILINFKKTMAKNINLKYNL